MRRLLSIFLLVVAAPFGAFAQPSFYVCAHPDDCLLFMNPPLYDDVRESKTKAVIIYLTSGDAGKPFSTAYESYPYVREQASLAATDWIADVDRPTHASKQKIETVTIHGHMAERVSYADTVSYFLRLPDGNYAGEGFQYYGLQSMQKLKNGEITKLASVDGRTTYQSWDDLLGMLSGIIAREAPNDKSITLHLAEPDTQSNHGDHSDHLHGARAILELIANESKDTAAAERCYTVYKHLGYAISDMKANLSNADMQNKAGSFAVLTATQNRLQGFDHWDKDHHPYLAQSYSTVETLPGSCNKPAE